MTKISGRAIASGAVFLALTVGSAAQTTEPVFQCSSDCADTTAAHFLPDLQAAGTRRVAVLPFRSGDGRSSPLGRVLADELRSRLAAAADWLIIVERENLIQAVEEQNLLGSGRMNSQSTAKMGEILGADTLITGVVTSGPDFVSVTVSAFSATTAEVLSSVTFKPAAQGPPAPFLSLVGPRVGGSFSAGNLNPAVQDFWEVDELRVEALAVRRPDRKLATVELRLVNTSDTEITLGIQKQGFGLCNASLMDEAGQTHLPIGDGRGSGTINCVVKTAKRDDYTTLGPGETEVALTFRAKEDSRIEGQSFKLYIAFAILEEDRVVRRLASLKNLRLVE